jgi:hypothetical protein
VAAADPQEAQTGGAMAPDEDALPEPGATGAVGAPSPAAGAAPEPTSAPAASPATAPGSNAASPVDTGAPIAGATPAG